MKKTVSARGRVATVRSSSRGGATNERVYSSTTRCVSPALRDVIAPPLPLVVHPVGVMCVMRLSHLPVTAAVDDSLVSATSSAAITSSEGKPTDVVKPRRGQYRRIGRRRVLALVHLVVRHGVLPQLVAAQMRFELCAGLWAARMASSASGVMRGMVPAWLRRGSVDDTPTAVGKGWNAFRIVGETLSYGAHINSHPHPPDL